MGLFFSDPATEAAIRQYSNGIVAGDSPPIQAIPMQAPAKHSGIGGILKGILGGAADGVASYYGATPGYSTSQENQRKLMQTIQELQYKAQIEDAQRRAKFADDRQAHVLDRQADIANPMPIELEQQIAMLRKQPGYENITIPQAMDILRPTISNGPQGQTFSPRSAMGMGGGNPPQEAIADLVKNPALAKDFDAAYGPGASQRYLGGGGSNATGGFQGGVTFGY